MKIGVDIDEVLASLIQGVFAYHDKIKGTNLATTSEVHSPYVQDYLNYSEQETATFLDEFFNSSVHDDIVPIFGAVEAIHTLKEHELIIITLRPEHVRTKTEEWIEKHFPEIFSEVHMLGDSLGVGGGIRTKGDLAQELGISVFIEDSLSNTLNISAKGIPVILLDKPWNQGELPENVYRVNTWEEVLERIKLLS